MVSVWRFRMRAGAETDYERARVFAVKNNVVGGGWNLPKKCRVPDRCNDFSRYLKHARKIHFRDRNNLNKAARIIGREIQIGDYGWAYFSHTGEYWCCKITGDFEFRTGIDFDDYHIHITRPCAWKKAGSADAVPGVIQRAFSYRFGTVSKIVTDADTALEAAEIIFGAKKPQSNGSLLAIANSDELEDLVALYLQASGWRVLPTTAKRSTASYEFILVHSETGKRAGIQVKGGNVSSFSVQVASDLDIFFVFAANKSCVIKSDNQKRLIVLTKISF